MLAPQAAPHGRITRAIITPHFQRYYCTPEVTIRPVPRDNNTSLLMIIRLVPSMINCHYNAFVVLLLPAFFCFQYHSATAAIHLQEFFNVLFPLSLSLDLGWWCFTSTPRLTITWTGGTRSTSSANGRPRRHVVCEGDEAWEVVCWSVDEGLRSAATTSSSCCSAPALLSGCDMLCICCSSAIIVWKIQK